jgi:hypothetical protein
MALKDEIFLGGACAPTTWRRDIAIPLLDDAGIAYYNPQVENWSPELVAIEAAAKREARWLLFVIGRETRAVASMIEAAQYCAQRPERVVLVVDKVYANAAGDAPDVVRDLERGRAYVVGVANDTHVPVFSTVEDAIDEIVRRAKEMK